jgi:Ca2+-binding EF-hand superfamily protein
MAISEAPSARWLRLVSFRIVIAVIATLVAGCDKAARPGSNLQSSASYTLIQQLGSQTTDLVDMDGRVVHSWKRKHGLAGGARLLPNGDLIRTGKLDGGAFTASLPAIGGVVERLDWDGKVLWSFVHSYPRKTLHHDVAMLPNGNLLLIGVEMEGRDEALAAGRDPAQMRDDTLWSDYLIEVSPMGPSEGKIVWEWHAWDHLIQDHDAAKRNHGVVSAHPELIDLNFTQTPPVAHDWSRIDAVAYNADFDQIMLTVRNFGEIWILDHGTSAAEAAGHSGGKRGHGGDLLYRWGNPQTYHHGKAADQKLFGPHDAHWIPAGLPGAGNVLIFNNGDGRRDGTYSSVDEIQLPVSRDGTYPSFGDGAYGPEGTVWRYVADPKSIFYSQFFSGAQRLANGNTLICSGMERKVFEVEKSGRTVWSHRLPARSVAAPMPVVAYPGPALSPPSLPPPFPGPPGAGGNASPPIPPLISVLDINGDGFIDESEIVQAAATLKKLDRDGDGALSIGECLPPPPGAVGGFPGPGGPGGPFGGPPGGPPPGGPFGGPPPGAPGDTQGPPPLPPIFTVLDSNGDRVIGVAEIALAPVALRTLDRNGDGRISLDECLPQTRGTAAPPGSPGSPPPLPPIINVFGPGRDGSISADAIAHAPEFLRKLDKNGDGRLTLDEYLPQIPGISPLDDPAGKGAPPRMPPIVSALDANGDGVIDAAEIANASAALARLDRNGDGRISLAEFLPGSPDAPLKLSAPVAPAVPGRGEEAIDGGLFRAVRFTADDPALKGRKLVPIGKE